MSDQAAISTAAPTAQQSPAPTDTLGAMRMIGQMPRMQKYKPIIDQMLAQKQAKVDGYSQDVRKGTLNLDKVPANDRGSVEVYMKGKNWSVPKPIPGQLQKALSDSVDVSQKVDGWLQYLETFRDPKTGKLPDERWDIFWAGIKYKFGGDDPLAAMISDFSRERWAAVAPLLHGVRRGDILQDMVQHTPRALPELAHPIPDSLSLMETKLKRLKANFGSARTALLRSYNYDVDPITGSPLPQQAPAFPLDGETKGRPPLSSFEKK